MSSVKRSVVLDSLAIQVDGKKPFGASPVEQTKLLADPGLHVKVMGGIAEDGTIKAFPVAADGTLKVDTEITLNGDAIIDNIKIGSTDGTNPNRYLSVDSDGHLQINVLDSSDAAVDPALASNQTDGSQTTQIVDPSNNAITSSAPSLGVRALDVNVAGSVPASVSVEYTDFNILAFDLSTIDTDFAGVDAGLYVRGSIQVVWSGATSSDAFATPGVFKAQISNDGSTWEDLMDGAVPTTVDIAAASGSTMFRKINFDFRYMRFTWDKNGITAGTADCFGVLKGA